MNSQGNLDGNITLKQKEEEQQQQQKTYKSLHKEA